MTDGSHTMKDLEQRISVLEQELKSKDKTLALLNSHFDEIQKLARTGHWELDLINNKLSWSDEIYRIFECAPQEFEATYEAFLSFIHPEDRDYVDKSYKNHVASRKSYDIVHRILTKNGKVKFVNERCKSVFDNNGKPICSLGTVSDITDRIKVETELKNALEKANEKEEKFINLYESLSVAYLIIKDGVCIECNDAALAIYGVESKDEIIGKSPVDFSPEFQLNKEKSSDEAKRYIKIAIEKGFYIFEWNALRKNKEKFYAEVSLKIFNYKNEQYIQCLVTDITERKKAETELVAAKVHAENNEKLLSDLINNSSSFIFLVDTEGKFMALNNSLAKFFNKPSEEIIGHTRDAFLPKEIAEEHLNNDRMVIESQKTISFEEKVEKSDGVHYYFGYRFPLTDKSGKLYGVGGIMSDITELKKTQNDLSIAKKQAVEDKIFLHTLINNLPDLIWLKDINGVYMMCNKRFENFIGISEQEIIGKTDYDIVSHELADFFRENDLNSIRAGKSILNEEKITFANDRHNEYLETIKTPFYKNSELIGVLGIGRNITERKKAELALLKTKKKVEESEIKFRQLAENLNDVVWLRKVNKIVYINPAFERMFGIKRKVLYEDAGTLYKIIHPGDIQKYKEALQTKEFLETGYFYCEYRIVKPDNEIRWIISKSSPIMDKNGNKTTLRVGIAIDITELKIIERELIEAKEKAEESDKLKTSFLQNMSHEIRTPLNAICGFSSLLSESNLSAERSNNFVQIIQNSSNQLLSIVSNILTISSLETKQEKINISVVCLNSIIIDLLTIFKQQAINQNVSIYIKQQLTDEQSEIYTDKTKITQILSNLISNALKFTHNGAVEFGYELIGNEIEFFVKDSGIGIKPELHETIFDRFRQADSTIQVQYGGTGLGLSICKGFVELLGGKIWVESEIGKGSIFYFSIPYKPVNEVDKATLPTMQNERQKTVLVAEDDEYNFLFIEKLLTRMHLKIIHAKNGREAVELFNSNPEIEFVLMDIKMPVMNGYDAAKAIKTIKPELPIVAQSAYAMEYEIINYKGIFDDYLTKPIEIEVLTGVVSRYLDV